MSWTDHQIQELKKMWGNGYSASDIAKTLGSGMTRNAVIGKAHRLKLSSAPSAMKAGEDAAARKMGGSVLPSMTKITKKRAMLRPLPTVQVPDVTVAKTTLMRGEVSPVEHKHPEGISVTKAGERHCRWPIGDPRSPDFRFCGCKCVDGLPYCADHARVAYQSIGKRSRTSETAAPAGAYEIRTMKSVRS